MKKTLIAFAALSAIAGVAQAQSTVTLYGLVDANVQSYKTNIVGTAANGLVPAGTIQNFRQTRIESGGLNGSRWGMRIKEDLGGGLSAVANLESGLALDTGASTQGGLLFGRRANVGVSSGFGTITIGRNTSAYDDVSADNAMMGQSIFDPSQTNNGPTNLALITGTGAPTTAAFGLLARNTAWLGYNSRFNNSVKYTSPNFSGFSGSFMYAHGEDRTPTVDASRTVSLGLKFANGPLLISGGYQSEGSTRTGGLEPAVQNTLLGVAYDFGVVKVGAGFNRAKLDEVVAGASIDAQKEWSLSVAVPLGATTLSAAYAQSKGDTLGRSRGFGIQALYALSKRSTLYAGAQSTKNYERLATFAPAGSNVGKTETYGLGLRHTF